MSILIINSQRDLIYAHCVLFFLLLYYLRNLRKYSYGVPRIFLFLKFPSSSVATGLYPSQLFLSFSSNDLLFRFPLLFVKSDIECRLPSFPNRLSLLYKRVTNNLFSFILVLDRVSAPYSKIILCCFVLFIIFLLFAAHRLVSTCRFFSPLFFYRFSFGSRNEFHFLLPFLPQPDDSWGPNVSGYCFLEMDVHSPFRMRIKEYPRPELDNKYPVHLLCS